MAELSIPKTCKAGVMYDEGPDFYVKVEQVPVPEPGQLLKVQCSSTSDWS